MSSSSKIREDESTVINFKQWLESHDYSSVGKPLQSSDIHTIFKQQRHSHLSTSSMSAVWKWVTQNIVPVEIIQEMKDNLSISSNTCTTDATTTKFKLKQAINLLQQELDDVETEISSVLVEKNKSTIKKRNQIDRAIHQFYITKFVNSKLDEEFQELSTYFQQAKNVLSQETKQYSKTKEPCQLSTMPTPSQSICYKNQIDNFYKTEQLKTQNANKRDSSSTALAFCLSKVAEFEAQYAELTVAKSEFNHLKAELRSTVKDIEDTLEEIHAIQTRKPFDNPWKSVNISNISTTIPSVDVIDTSRSSSIISNKNSAAVSEALLEQTLGIITSEEGCSSSYSHAVSELQRCVKESQENLCKIIYPETDQIINACSKLQSRDIPLLDIAIQDYYQSETVFKE